MLFCTDHIVAHLLNSKSNENLKDNASECSL